MPLTIHTYLAPPRGYRTRKYRLFRRWSIRNKEEGPYELFITYARERALAVSDDSLPRALELWQAAENDMHAILWGNSAQRETAKDNLESLSRRSFGGFGVGWIGTENWFNAGNQLEKAVRDYHVYGSTARFEDIRDFIWERIRNMKYPTNWRVKREDFAARIEETTQHYSMIRHRSLVDTHDSVFHEWLRENPPYDPPSYRSTPERYIFPPIGYRKQYVTNGFTEDINFVPELTSRNPEDGPYGIFIKNTENWSIPCSPDNFPRLK
ncbi:hypothetical protein BO71DRAFT_424599 [Aspergillus ellipticus CBS 707.79]|uniref:Uncharacterized protein n=1 Tax=Aspergillus ellipticus CBS 707.79 TaxID=1448320 RepID=A0A319E946_9EURO|nr:hypothetical protein BO71DRAFT_424599 [Aspergillus ellipticus CBS 707.79]